MSNSKIINGWKLNKKEATRSIYNAKTTKLNEHAEYQMVSSFVSNNMGIDFSQTHPQSKYHSSENLLMTRYLKQKFAKKDNCFKIKVYFPKHRWGRIIPVDYLSLSVMHRPTRHALCKDIYVDIDLENSSQKILLEICKNNNHSSPKLEEYCLNRATIMNSIMEHHECGRDTVKRLFISMSFGGSYENWIKSNITEKTEKMEFVKEFENEYNVIKNIIYESNKIIIEDVEKCNPCKFDKYASVEGMEDAKKRTCMALWYQTIERHVQERMIIFLVEVKKMNLEDIVPCQDGFMILKDLYYEGIIEDCEIAILTGFNLNLTLKVKEFDEAIHIPTVEIEDIPEPEESTSQFKIVADEFEKTHCKIINKSFFIKTCEEGFRVMTEKQIITSYKHMTYKNNDGVPTNFIDHWLKNNPYIRCYDDIGVYPKKGSCPKNMFNMWEDFAMEKVSKYDFKCDELKFILNHIKILCKNEEPVYTFLMCWLAHIVQFPEEKSIVPTLISQEGAGKSTLIILLTHILGNSKMFETAKPSRDIWGNFNGKMKDCFFVNLNELCLKEMQNFEGEFKKLVTEPTITINEKGVSQYEIKSFHRFFITSNKEIPVKTGRRTFIIRCSDELKGNTEYFNRCYEYINDVNVQKTFYEYLKNYTYNGQNMSCFREMMTSPPTTDYELEIRESYLSIPEQFLKHFTIKNINKSTVEKTGKELFEMFLSWKSENNVKYDTTVQKLGVSITYLNLKGVMKKHTRDGATKIYDIQFLKEYFKIGDEMPGKCFITTTEDEEEEEKEKEVIEELVEE